MAEEQPKTDAGGTDQLAGLQSRVDEMSSLFKQWEAARGAAARTRVGVFIVVLLVILAYGLFIFNTFGQVRKPEYQERLMAAASKSATVIMERKGAEVQQAIKRLRPVYEEQLRKDIQENQDEMGELVLKEVDLLSKNLSDMAEARLRAKLDGMAAKHKEQVRAAFPSIKEDKDLDMIISNLQKSLTGASYDVLSARIKVGEERLAQVTDKVLLFLPEDRRTGFAERMDKVLERFLLEDLGGKKQLEE